MQLNINGKIRDFDGDPSMPLLWALRDVLGLCGTKFGCAKGLCGACTIHIDGEAVKSCLAPVSAAVGHKLTTIEGLSTDGSHPVQIAWQDIQVPQCGYCQPGQIMCAAAMLAKNKSPSDDDINTAMAGNICRCGTYPRIRSAIKAAAQSMRGQP
jgi:isoquinoline 1-oxidoreductase alpha subunit